RRSREVPADAPTGELAGSRFENEARDPKPPYDAWLLTQ
ncbi:MAG: hypothetical protein ACI9EF_000460, partial [Pseudohongiellaceae bacterium]